MVKSELFNNSSHSNLLIQNVPMASCSSKPSALQAKSVTDTHHTIDSYAIDISSVKGRFAWERITTGDTYLPVIFRGTTKYFCVKMLHKLLPEYPEDIFRCPSNYHYPKLLPFYVATPSEIELLNRINAQHCHWMYGKEQFTVADELVRATDFIPFYEHIRTYIKTPPVPLTSPISRLEPVPSSVSEGMNKSFDHPVMSSCIPAQNGSISQPTAHTPIGTYTTADLCQNEKSSNLRLAPLTLTPQSSSLTTPCSVASKDNSQASSYSSTTSKTSLIHGQQQQQQQQLLPITTRESQYKSSGDGCYSTAKVSTTEDSTLLSVKSPAQSSTFESEASTILTSQTTSASTIVNTRQSLTTPLEHQLAPNSMHMASSSAISKSTCLSSGWLQINKLYTPYVSTNASCHQSYKIPISLLTFYDLIKTPTSAHTTNESKDTSYITEQAPATIQEIELINELCVRQNIRPFSVDTKLINLLTFYKYSSASILFIKELSLNDPKSSIYKDWSSVVQINGGICRLRSITTLHEQTVPFIGNNVLKNFILTSQCLSSAIISTPKPQEIEFLQLILFFSNMSVNLHNAVLIDIESVRKEYTIDLILLFNDKFPLNVLSYQNQVTASSMAHESTARSNSSTSTNTFAQSTPPPSPTSPSTINNNNSNTDSHNSTLTKPSMSPVPPSSNRYQKEIIFHGYPVTSYICSGLQSDTSRECISVNSLCAILFPNSLIMDKLEAKMLRLLRLKNINRYRPQSQQTTSLTRLVDIKDIEKHWNYIQKEMRTLSKKDTKFLSEHSSSSSSDKALVPSTLNSEAYESEEIREQTPTETNKNQKRPSAVISDEEPTAKRIEKDLNTLEDSNNQSKLVTSDLFEIAEEQSSSTNQMQEKTSPDSFGDHERLLSKTRRIFTASEKSTNQENNKKNKKGTYSQVPNDSLLSLQAQTLSTKKKIKIIRRRQMPSSRHRRQIKPKWILKYNIEECCVRLDSYVYKRYTSKK